MQWIFGFILLVGAVCGNDSFFKDITNFNKFADLPNFDDVADIEGAVKDKCKANGGENAFKNLKSSVIELQSYIVSNFEIGTIKNEVEAARKTGSMDEVFKVYCDKKPQYMRYANKLGDAIETCLTEKERPLFKLASNITESVIDFICEKDGDRLGMFIAEGGFACVASKSEGLQKCGTETITPKIPTKFDTIPTLAITKEECDDFQKVRKCVVTTLEECENKTPANLIDAFIKTIYKLTPCPKLK